MKRFSLVLLLISLWAYPGFSQQYDWAVGLRLGGPSGFTIKKSISASRSLEGILSPGSHGFLATGLLEINAPMLSEPGLTWFYGVGGHAGFWDGEHPSFARRGTYAYGLDGILGMEYSFTEFPLVLSLDWKPSFNVVEETYLNMADGAVSIRFKL